jgi:hypothetical protein
MSYRLQRQEPVNRSIRRIGREQLADARAALDKRGHRHAREEAVHATRTALKKVRALMDLVQLPLGPEHARMGRKLRRIGQLLAPLRDAAVVIDTVDQLAARFEEDRGKQPVGVVPALHRLRDRLVGRLDRVDRRMRRGHGLQVARRALSKLRRRARHWDRQLSNPTRGAGPLSRRSLDDWNLIAGGLCAGYQRARDCGHAAAGQPGDDAFHAWRKAVKAHAHQVRLLLDCEPVALASRLGALDLLGELLGEDHDLSVFIALVHKHPRWIRSGPMRHKLGAIAHERQDELRARTLSVAADLFDQTPAAFTRQLGHSWRIWRGLVTPSLGRLALVPATSAAATGRS